MYIRTYIRTCTSVLLFPPTAQWQVPGASELSGIPRNQFAMAKYRESHSCVSAWTIPNVRTYTCVCPRVCASPEVYCFSILILVLPPHLPNYSPSPPLSFPYEVPRRKLNAVGSSLLPPPLEGPFPSHVMQRPMKVPFVGNEVIKCKCATS